MSWKYDGAVWMATPATCRLAIVAVCYEVVGCTRQVFPKAYVEALSLKTGPACLQTAGRSYLPRNTKAVAL